MFLMFHHTALPAPPTNLRVTFINSTSVTISWQAPPPVSTITIASYRLVVSETEFGLNDTVASSTTTSYTFTRLEEYNNYTCSLVSISTYDVISIETVISFTTPQGGRDSLSVESLYVYCREENFSWPQNMICIDNISCIIIDTRKIVPDK